MTKQRLSKFLATAGVASRRAAETLIFDGRVAVNGEKVIVPQTLVDPEVDKVTVDRKPVVHRVERLYYALNKPVGYQCTNDPRIKRRAVDLVPAPEGARLFTVGRLDKETAGLILVTNDGHFANKVMHPSGGIKKEYIAKVDREITHDHLVALSKGCAVEGVLVRPVRVAKIRRGTVRIVVQEGRRHEVRQMLAAVGFTVLELKRVKIGQVSLGSLPEGQARAISPDEVFPKARIA
jgi:23S rRNA pseudouridine2605 synthase